MNITPIIYQYICTTSSCILTLPLDIVQTKIITSSDISFNLNELKWVLLFPLIFTSQNIIYTNLFNVKNVNSLVQGSVHGGSSGASPVAMGRTYFLKLSLNFEYEKNK